MTVMRSRVTMQVFGVYLVVIVGLGLMLTPHLILGIFGLSVAKDVWIRMVGMLASIVGAYYLIAANYDAQLVYR